MIRTIDTRDELGDVVCEIGEGPIWDERFGVLRWVDILRGFVHGHDPRRGQLPSLELGQPVGFVVPTGAGRLLAGVRDGFALVDVDGGATELAVAVDRDRPGMRMNDGKADPAGRVWASTMAIDPPFGPDGTLYRLGTDRVVEPQLAGLTIPNGIGWSPDGGRMYFTDTTWGRVDVFDYDVARGEASGQRTFVEIPPQVGQPDGLTVDEDACVWVALWGGGAVHRYTPDGRLDTVVRIPAPQAASCVFGGPDMRDLFITSARFQLGERELAEHPRSGRVFACRPGVAGLPTAPYVSA